MPGTFERSGVRFQYAENWKLEQEESDAGWTVTLQSPGAAFIVVSLHGDAVDAAELADLAMEAIRKEYETLEADHVVETLAKLPAVGYDMEFFLYDLLNTAWSRCIETTEGCLLILAQFTEAERESGGAVARAVLESLSIED